MPSPRIQTLEDLGQNCLSPGDLLDGRYRIERVIGEGTFAWVYLARHETIETLQCAIKVLKPHFVGDEEMQRQFLHEAETVARLRDRHTVRVSDLGALPDGRPYICMEYCIGATLDRILARHGALPDAMVAHIARGVLHSLREAHDLGIVHRDIKPSNISLSEDASGTAPLARVLDFGIAYVAQIQGVGDDNVDSDLVFCTPSYAAPEVLRGDVTVGADIYALGLTMAELLEGEPVFPNTGFYTVAARQMANERVPFGPKTLASKLLPFLQVACEKERSKRFSSAIEMLDTLDELTEELDDDEIQSWAHFMPPNCVGTERCSLASSRLDMAVPAGCAQGCLSKQSDGPELRVRDQQSIAPAAPMDFHEFDELQQALDESDTFGSFLHDEFSDETTGRSAGTKRVPAGFGRPGDEVSPPNTEPQTQYPRAGTVRTRRMAVENMLTTPQHATPSSNASGSALPRTILERYRAQLQRALEERLTPRAQRVALLITNATIAALILSLLLVVLLRGFPG